MNSKLKPRILVFSTYYLPGFLGGGPIRSVANMVSALSDDFEFLVYTSNHDLGVEATYDEVQSDSWVDVGSAKVFYASRKNQNTRGVLSILRSTKCDLVYFNSFFDFKFSIRPILLAKLGLVPIRPMIVAPRGEFSVGALRLKFLKKLLYIFLSRLFGLYDGLAFHASTEIEKQEIESGLSFGMLSKPQRNISFATPISIASDLIAVENGLAASCLDDESPAERGVLKVCFLSRITPKKNLELALRVLAKSDKEIIFSIYGPVEDFSYWKRCQRLIEELPSNITVHVLGAVRHEEIKGILRAHDIFFLPTLGENFGHVFLEAWGAGLPVLVSDRTPWRGLAELKVGWDIPLENINDFVDVIESVFSMNHSDFRDIRETCRSFAASRQDSTGAIVSNRNMFNDAMKVLRS